MANKKQISKRTARNAGAKQRSRSSGKKKASAKPDSSGSATSRPAGFPIVGLGASAGGLEALQEFFDHAPANSGMAFVVVTHQHPGHTSMLAPLLASHTAIPVVDAGDGTQVLPNHVYVGPPGHILLIHNGRLHRMDTLAAGTDVRKTRDQDRSAATDGSRLTPRGRDAVRLPIDWFLRSLAEDQHERAICVILSGTGSDGTLGLRSIKAASGMAMVQETSSAKYAGMPSSAIATGLADFVLSPREMPKQLMAYAQTPYLTVPEARDYVLPEEPLSKILLLLRARTGHDFSSYKVSTIRRRIERRMGVHASQNPNDYVRHLHSNPHEIDILFKELLISVTSFFRDADAWASLATDAIPKLIETWPDTYTFRAWIPGCGTGEEAYTLAILLREATERFGKHFDFQIFGTDLDTESIEAARAGLYPDGIAADVSPVRLDRYFTRVDGTYRIRKDLREMCVFAQQNVIKDPPFTKLDLICCRNLLIYLNADMQHRLLPIFHYALKPAGILMLGPSETIGPQSDLFGVIDKKWKIFERRETVVTPRLPAIPAHPIHLPDEPATTAAQPTAVAVHESHIATLVHRLLLARYAPASVVVNERGDIAYIHGRTGLYLEPSAGQPKMNVLDMAREGLRIELTGCLRQATNQDGEVRRESVRVGANGGDVYVDLTVSRIADPATIRGLYLVTMRPAAGPTTLRSKRKARRGEVAHDPVAQLERELQYTRESLQTTVEELETSNEELKSTNEELQSTNEELQSSNEELETSKEEMQSLNEELNTVNAEMQGKLDELSRANDDLHNLLNSTEVATVFLDMQLRIKRFTDSASRLIKLIPSDVGRSIGDLKTNLKHHALENDAREVLRTLVWREANVESEAGLTFLMRIMPYRTVENVIDGVVITFIDITTLREAERTLTVALEFGRMGAWRWDLARNAVTASDVQYRLHGRKRGDVAETYEGWAELVHPDDHSAVHDAIEDARRSRRPWRYECRVVWPDSSVHWLAGRGQFIYDDSGEPVQAYGVAADIDDLNSTKVALELSDSIFQTLREPLLVLDEQLRVVRCNPTFCRAFGVVERQIVGERIFEASDGAWNHPDLRRLLEEILPANTTIEDFALTHTFSHVGEKRMLLNARRLQRLPGLPPMILLAMEEVHAKGTQAP